MVSRRRRRKSCAAFVAAWLVAAPVQARVLELDVERLVSALGRVESLAAKLEWPEGATQGQLDVRAGILDASGLGYRFRDLHWSCSLERPAPDAFGCVGAVRARGLERATLKATWREGQLDLELSGAGGQLAMSRPADAAAPVQLRATKLPAAWLQPLLSTFWDAGKLTAGTLDATLDIGEAAAGGTELSGPLAFAGFGLDSADGRIAAAEIDAGGRFRLGLQPDRTAIELDLELRGGEFLAGALYASLPPTPVGFALTMQAAEEGRWTVPRLAWTDAGVLELSGNGSIDLDRDPWLRALELRFESGDLGRAHARYLQSLTGTLGLAELHLGGSASGNFALRDGTPADLDLGLRAVDARDGAERFDVRGLDGRLRWTASSSAVDGDLAWNRAQIGPLAFGTANLPLRSAQRGLGLRAPVSLSLFGGTLDVPRFAWSPAGAEQRGTRLDLSLEPRGLDLSKLSAAFDWPAFTGSLSGEIPGVRYADEVLAFDGGLDVDVFGGALRIGALTLERPFGVAPTLAADIEFDDLDLKPLTGAFGFGEITGRLDGHVRGLRLLDWAPIAFDADLHTDTAAKDPRRISQRAVDDLTRVGGGGIAAGIQNRMLKLFDTFGYRRIGLKCRLANNVCHMDGVDSSGNGYTIVEGSGLPRVTVIGHQRQVDWPVLVARLKAATEGQVPIVE
jgi:hypothetical protein